MNFLKRIRNKSEGQVVKNKLILKPTGSIPSCTKPFHVLIITDTHDHACVNGLDDFLYDVEDVDAVFSLGDVTHKDFSAINSCEKLSGIPKYGILGNHDYFSVLKDCGIESIHNKAVEINGVRFAGMYGSIKYKNANAPMFTEQESISVAASLPKCDVLLTHDKARETPIDGEHIRSHDGLLGIGLYIKEHSPAWHIHGHLHENMKENIFGTPSVCFCRYAYLRISEKGVEILKVFGPKFENN